MGHGTYPFGIRRSWIVRRGACTPYCSHAMSCRLAVDVLALHYNEIKSLHIACVALSGSLFTFRGLHMMCGSPLANHIYLARVSYVIDTILLAAAVLLTIIIHQYPVANAWLSVKLLCLIGYVLLGIFALRRGKTRRRRSAYFVAALLVYGFIISVAVTHNPRGLLSRSNHAFNVAVPSPVPADAEHW
jgi:uncharacterized membrane protein SirB2